MRGIHDRSAAPSSGTGLARRLARLVPVLLFAAGLLSGCDPKKAEFFGLIDPFDPDFGDVVGQVTVDGEPRSGVTVTLSRDGQVVGTVTTGSAGQYEFINLDPGTYSVSIASIPGAQCPGPQTAQVVADEETVVDFPCTSVPTTGTVTGRVFDEDGGGGLANAQVALNGQTTTTDASGNFTFENVEPGTKTLQATVTAFQCAARSANVTAGETTNVEIPCDRTHPTAQQIGQRPFRLMGTLQGDDQCGIGSTISNPGPITIRIEVIDGETFMVIESDADVIGVYRITQLWVGMGEITFTSGGTTFRLRETVEGLWELVAGTVVLTGTLEFLVTVDADGTEVCRNTYLATYEQLAPSSARFKTGVRSLLPGGGAPLGLRPVAFRYRSPWGDPRVPRIGLLAEDVARVFPEAVGFDAAGRPEGIYYLTLRRMVAEELEARAARAVTAGITRLAEAF